MTQTMQEYAKLKKMKAQQEADFKEWNRQVDARLKELLPTVCEEIQASGNKSFHLHDCQLSLSEKAIATAKTDDFTAWLKEDPERLKYATVKPRQREIDAYVKEHGEPPSEIIKYERYTEVICK